MRYKVEHQTVYQYDSMVSQSQQMLHLAPRATPYQYCLHHTLKCEPKPVEQSMRTDYFGNHCQYFTILRPHQSLTVTSYFEVECLPRPTIDALQPSPSWEEVRKQLQQPHLQHPPMIEASGYVYHSPKVGCSKALIEYATTSFNTGKPLIAAAMSLTQQIYQEFKFDAHATDVSTPLEDVLKGKRGVCQDFAHLMIGVMRSIGLACRYVSGYILTHPPQGRPRLVGADASHAWVSVFCPINGWIDFDPTNNCLVQQEHITVAWGRDFSDVSPMRGVVLGGGQQQLKVRVTVTPLTSLQQLHI
jgi:transglutaminase-like putative cysteine protease